MILIPGPPAKPRIARLRFLAYSTASKEGLLNLNSESPPPSRITKAVKAVWIIFL